MLISSVTTFFYLLQSFALVTYAQALCALRALNLLNDFCLDEIQGSESPRLQIKVRVLV